MSSTSSSPGSGNPGTEARGDEYEIVVNCHLDDRWSEWFGHLALTNLEKGNRILTGRLPDQVAIHRLLARISDLNITVISVRRIDSCFLLGQASQRDQR